MPDQGRLIFKAFRIALLVAFTGIAGACDSPSASAAESCPKRPSDENVLQALSEARAATTTKTPAKIIWGVTRETCSKYMVLYGDGKHMQTPAQLFAFDDGRWGVFITFGMGGSSLAYVETKSSANRPLPTAPAGKDTVYSPRKETN